MDRGFALFLVALYGNDCVVMGNLLQTCKSVYKHRKQLIEKHTVVEKDLYGGTTHELNSMLHCEYGPAYVSPGVVGWYRFGKRCNAANGGPGFESGCSRQYYDDNGKLHRDHPNPAKIYTYDGVIIEVEYWIHGKRIK